MHDFCYVSRKDAAPIKKELLNIIREVQKIVRDDFTFQFSFVGSSKRNMITRDRKSNIGFDFDINIEVNDDDENYNPKQLNNIIRSAINKVSGRYGYDHAEDSTRVLTIKLKDRKNNRIIHRCDFAIIYNCDDGSQQYIRYNKSNNTYTWEFQPAGFCDLPDKIDWLKKRGLWNDLRDYYIKKKNLNVDSNKHSRSIFAESIHETCQKNGYYNQ